MQLDVMCNLSYATTQICSCMCRMQLNFNYKRQLQNPKFLVVYECYFETCYKFNFFKKKSNNNVGVLWHIKKYYKCYEIAKNGSLHIHTLLWFNDSPYFNTLIQTSCDDENFWENMIDYLNEIIT